MATLGFRGFQKTCHQYLVFRKSWYPLNAEEGSWVQRMISFADGTLLRHLVYGAGLLNGTFVYYFAQSLRLDSRYFTPADQKYYYTLRWVHKLCFSICRN